MPITKRAIKKLRRDLRLTRRTAKIRLTLRTIVKTARKNPSKKNLSAAFRALDKAAKTNIVHRNKAARLKSRLAKLLKK